MDYAYHLAFEVIDWLIDPKDIGVLLFAIRCLKVFYVAAVQFIGKEKSFLAP